MVKIGVDISVFTPDAAVGMASGSLDVVVVPQMGDVIAFRASDSFEVLLQGKKTTFSGLIQVTKRIIAADGEGVVQLILEDITAATKEDAKRLLEMFDQHYGLFADVWEG